jgi:hypothetical protein
MTILSGVNSNNHKINHKLIFFFLFYKYLEILLKWCQIMAFLVAHEWNIRFNLIWTHQIKRMKYIKKTYLNFKEVAQKAFFTYFCVRQKIESGKMKKENSVEG